MASDDSLAGPPPKRLRLSTPDELGNTTMTETNLNKKSSQPAAENEGEDDQLQKEIKAGITEFVSPDTPGFTGVLKQRYEQRGRDRSGMNANCCFTLIGTPTSW
jgi:tRNA pseudouridine13 synthase